MKTRKRQTAVKGRFSAMLISAAVHVAVLIAAGAFVAVTVVQRQEARFEGRQVSRPRMQLQRLQVPQRARMERQAPQMSQRVTAEGVSTRSVDFQMPEIAGLGGGISVDMSGAGFSGSLGFATPQINLFGLRSQGEKVVFILDATEWMLVDELGGVTAYQVIKDELTGMLNRLPPTALFNVIVFENHQSQAFSKDLVNASSQQVEKVVNWLAPLNSERGKTGLQTLTEEGHVVQFEPMVPIPNQQPGWLSGVSYAIQRGADSVYFLAATDYIHWIARDLYEGAKRGRPVEPPSGQPDHLSGLDLERYPGGEQRWNRLLAEARKMHEEENARRRAAGMPDRAIARRGYDRGLVIEYFPGIDLPELKRDRFAHNFGANDITEYIRGMLQKYRDDALRESARRRMGADRFSFNVIHFVPANEPERVLGRVRDIPSRFNGRYIQLAGLEAIQAMVSQ